MSLLGDIADVGTTVTVDPNSIVSLRNALLVVVAFGLIMWLIVQKAAK